MNIAAHYNANLHLELPDGDAGIDSTLTIMKAMVDDAIEAGGPVLRLATAIAADTADARSDELKLIAIHRYLVSHVRFMKDTLGQEHLRHPDQLALELLETGATAGDCDDVATLGAALLRAMGIQPAFIVVSIKPSGEFQHVLFAAVLGEKLIPMDPQERMFGSLPRIVTRKKVFVL